MLVYLGKRLLATIPVMLLVALIVFSLLYLAPGDPAAIIGGDTATPADMERIRVALGLDRPFLVRFAEWLFDVVRGDLGTSIFTGIPVADLIAQRIVPTASLMGFSILISILVGVPLGVLAASQLNGLVDKVVLAISTFGFSVPVFIIGYMLAYLFAVELKWFPVQGYRPPSAGLLPFVECLVLPAVSLSVTLIALIARVTRASVLEVLSQDYIRTARAKGAGPASILFVHSLKNAAVPIVTIIGISVAALIGGAIVTESVFGIPGLGRLTVDALMRHDYPVIQGIVLFFSLLYVLVNLIVDFTYTLFDPRIRY